MNNYFCCLINWAGVNLYKLIIGYRIPSKIAKIKIKNENIKENISTFNIDRLRLKNDEIKLLFIIDIVINENGMEMTNEPREIIIGQRIDKKQILKLPKPRLL